MNEAQKILDDLAKEAAFKSATKDVPMEPHVERLCRTMFAAGWISHRQINGIHKSLEGFS